MTFKPSILALLVVFAPAALASEGEAILIHPFQSTSSFSLTETAQSLGDNAEALVRNHGLNPRVMLAPKASPGLLLQSDAGDEAQDFGYSIDGFPLCDYQLKIHRDSDGALMVFGEVPSYAGSDTFRESDWAELGAVEALVRDAQLNEGRGADSSISKSSRCLLLEGGALKAVWRLDVMTSGLLYEATVDGDRVYSIEDKHFHAGGSAKIFNSNASGSPLQATEIKELSSGGHLINNYFETCVAQDSSTIYCPSNNEGADIFAQSQNGKFDFDPISQADEFAQASIFTNVNKVLDWARSQGYANFGNARIRVVAHATFATPRGDDPNNALYQPSATPTIYVGDGDGRILKNLAIDEDVVSHEFGHHIVYHTVTNIKDEALVLHEGLADFFTFARTGNACLGETICPATPEGDSACYVARKCLRTGENTLKWGASNLPAAPHLRGQLVSGMMWDLYKTDGIPLKDVTRLTLKAIDLMVASSGYQHLILALLVADKDIYQGNYCDRILSRAKSRGFGEFLTDTNCKNISLPQSADAAPATPSSSPKKSKNSFCGVLSASSSSGQFGGFLVIWFIPLIVAWLRRFRA